MSSKAKSDYTVRREGRIAIKRETDKNGRDTGHAYYFCPECGGEILTRYSKDCVHKAGCSVNE